MTDAPAPKPKKGLMDRLKEELLEDSGSSSPAPKKGKKAPEPAPAAAPPAPSMLSSFGIPAAQSAASPFTPGATAMAPSPIQHAAPAVSPIVVGTTPPSSPLPEPVDPEALALLQGQVLVEKFANDQPSRFLVFVRTWEAMGQPADTASVLRVLQITQPSLTAADLLADMQSHVALLDKASADAEAAFARAAQDRLGGKDTELQSLDEANKHAVAEIERHNREIGERNAKITSIQTARAEDEAAIQRGRQRSVTAEGVVRARLLQFQNLLAR
jgi:hypothetical protein